MTAEKDCCSRCIGAGMQIQRDAQSYKPESSSPVVFDINVRGLVPEQALVVPHSELAMHVGAAGKKLIAWILTRNYAHIIFDDDGCCGSTHGLPNEVMSNELIEQQQKMWPYLTRRPKE